MKKKKKDKGSSSSSNDSSPKGEPSLVLILKWGGELTPAGKIQAEELGKAFRCMYPGGRGLFQEFFFIQGLACYVGFWFVALIDCGLLLELSFN